MKQRKRLILSCLLALLYTGMALADADTWVYVAKSSGGITNNGVAAYSSSNEYTMRFDDEGNAVITYGTVNVAKLLKSEIDADYELVTTLSAPTGTTGSITKTIGAGAYATIYSPFAITVSGADVTAYAPTYAVAMKSLLLSDETTVSGFVPAGTGLVLKNAGDSESTATITFADGTGMADTHTSCLFGSAIGAATPTQNDNNDVFGLNSGATGFTKYTGETLALTDAYYLNDNEVNPVKGDDMAFISSEADVPAGSFCAYVQQTINNEAIVVTADGANLYDVSDGTTSYTLCFDEYDNAVIKNSDDKTVASLPINSDTNGELVVSAENTTGMKLGYITVSNVSSSSGDYKYSTFYSPFNLSAQTGSGVTAYAPSLISGNTKLSLSSSNKFEDGAVIPAGTALLLSGVKGADTSVTFNFSNEEATDDNKTLSTNDALSGTALTITDITEKSVYALGGTGDSEGFLKLTATTLYPAKAWLALPSGAKSFIGFDFGEPTDIDNVNASTGSAQAPKEGKFIINGRVVIIKGGRMYNLNGQEVN